MRKIIPHQTVVVKMKQNKIMRHQSDAKCLSHKLLDTHLVFPVCILAISYGCTSRRYKKHIRPYLSAIFS